MKLKFWGKSSDTIFCNFCKKNLLQETFWPFSLLMREDTKTQQTPNVNLLAEIALLKGGFFDGKTKAAAAPSRVGGEPRAVG